MYFTLRFDAATEEAVRGLWRRIASSGIDVSGLTGHRPRVTLVGYEVDRAERYRSALAEFALGVAPLSIEFGHLGVFPDAGVVFLAPTVNQRLLAVHRALVERFAGLARMKHDQLLPDRWVPHCTLVIGVDPAISARVVVLCHDVWQPITGTVEGIGALVPPEVVDRYGCPLSSPRR
ncbi:MAG: 2'-5' RNA ligase family protein [Chloroflexota bacterium]|nr:2'-5' RNA ligase family protein [Chloroflexota bacterium]